MNYAMREKYERNAGRASTRAGHYTRNLHTTSRHVKLNVPKLRNTPFGNGNNKKIPQARDIRGRISPRCIWLEFQYAAWKT